MSDLWSWGAPKAKGTGQPRQSKPKQPSLLEMPEVPETMWRVPETLPDLSNARIICFDCETYDPELIDKGPGFVRGKAHIVGIAIGTDDGYRGYFPIRHTMGGNMSPEVVLKWAARELGRPRQIKINHNIAYDLEALSCEGVEVKGTVYCTMIAEALLDEAKFSYSLDATAQTHLGEHKVDEALYKWSHRAYGGSEGRKQAANIYRCPVSLVGPYAEGDVDLPLRVFEVQRKQLELEGLWELFEMECSLLPMLLAMRKRGVRVNVERAEQAQEHCKKTIVEARAELYKLSGMEIDVWAAESVSKAYDRQGIPYNKTPTGKPSFTNDFFNNSIDPISRAIQAVRKGEKFLGTFIEGYILNSHINGRVYCQFHPLRSDEGGTISGRFSSSTPNLQNVPSRDPVLGPMIRSFFIPEEGCEWIKDDYSQIEPRILLHYATGEVAANMRDTYAKHPDTDFYTLMTVLCDINRRQSKGITLGSMYGMGVDKLALELGLTKAEAAPLLEKYHKALPFVKTTSDAVQQAATNRGWIKTLLGRRARFNTWEPAKWDDKRPALPRERAEKEYGNIRRARTYKALNALIQGSAADVMKKAMSDIWKAGICEYIGAPHLTVHDELDWSVCRHSVSQVEAHEEALHIMQTCVKLQLPLICDTEKGPSWGEVK